MQDFAAMLRRRAKIILIPTLLAPLAGYLISYVFPAKFTSQSVVLVEAQKVPESMVQPVVSQDLTARVSTLQQQILAESKLRPLVDRLFPQKNPADVGVMIDTIRANLAVESVPSDLLAIDTSNPKAKQPNTSPFPGFYVKYTAPGAREAQMVCNQLTTMLVDENSRQIAEAATGTSEVPNRGIEDAKNNLDGMDAKLAEFKKQYVGQLPGDKENNLKILTGLNSQLAANTQTLNRAQQDKSYAAQQVAAWKNSQITSPETLRKQLSELQTQLLQLKSKYTDDHPDVIKTKADIDAVKTKLADINKASVNPADDNIAKGSPVEPAEIRQLRLEVHQYEDFIAAATRDQKHLQQEISGYQSKVSLSPAVEEQYKQLTRDYDNALKSYQDQLAKKSSADLTVKMNNQAVGERMFPLNPADLPDSPSFPNRLFFALGGLAAGLAVGAGIALLLELKDNSIRDERDAEAVLELPTLIAIPWVLTNTETNDHGRFKFWRRKKALRNGSAVVRA